MFCLPSDWVFGFEGTFFAPLKRLCFFCFPFCFAFVFALPFRFHPFHTFSVEDDTFDSDDAKMRLHAEYHWNDFSAVVDLMKPINNALGTAIARLDKANENKNKHFDCTMYIARTLNESSFIRREFATACAAYNVTSQRNSQSLLFIQHCTMYVEWHTQNNTY